MDRAENKSARLNQIENLLLAHPEGLTQADLARRLGVQRSTILRNLPDLPGHIYEDDDGRLKIDRTQDLINVRFNLHEAMAVHLASRLLATRMDRQNRHAAAALRKLGLAMERWAKKISNHVLQSADVMDDSARRDDPVYLQVLEKLTLAWAEQRKIQIWYWNENGDRVFEYHFSPFFIEPYAIGQTTYALGLARLLGEGAWTAERMRTGADCRAKGDAALDSRLGCGLRDTGTGMAAGSAEEGGAKTHQPLRFKNDIRLGNKIFCPLTDQ